MLEVKEVLGFDNTEFIKEAGDLRVIIVSGMPEMKKVSDSAFSIEIKNSVSKYPVKGSVSSNSKLVEIMDKAIEAKIPLILRLERRRLPGVDVNIPIDDFQKTFNNYYELIENALVGIYNIKDRSWILDGNKADPEDDSNKLKLCLQEAIGDIEQAWGRDTCLTTMYFLIREKEREYNYELPENKRRDIAIKLLELSNKIQAEINGSEINDYMHYSHNRARYTLFSYESFVNNLNEEATQDIDKWVEECLNFSTEITKWSKEV